MLKVKEPVKEPVEPVKPVKARKSSIDVFKKYNKAPIGSKVKAMPTPAAKILSLALGGAGGYFLTPATRIPVLAVAGLLGVGLGKGVGEGFSILKKSAAEPAAAAVLAEGLDKKTLKTGLAEVALDYDVPAAEFKAKLSNLFTVFASSCFETSGNEHKEYTQLRKLKTSLGLGILEAEEAFLKVKTIKEFAKIREAAAPANKGKPGYDEAVKLRKKIVFLIEGIIGEERARVGEEGYIAIARRFQYVLEVAPDNWIIYVRELAEPIYNRALRSIAVEGKPATIKDLEDIRKSLFILPLRAKDMHASALAASIEATLAKNGKFTKTDQDRLTNATVVFNMSGGRSRKTFEDFVKPLYVEDFEKIYDETVAGNSSKSAMEMSQALAQRAQALLLNSTITDAIEEKILVERLQSGGEKVMKMKKAGARERIARLKLWVNAYDKIATFMAQSQRIANEDELASFLKVKGTTDLQSIQAMYDRIVKSGDNGTKIDVEGKHSVDKLCQISGMNQSIVLRLYEDPATIAFKRDIEKSLADNVLKSDARRAEQKEFLKTRGDNLVLPSKVAQDVKLKAYAKFLAVGDKEKVEQKMRERSDNIPNMLGLSKSEVTTAYDNAYGSLYERTLAAAMGLDGDNTKVEPNSLSEQDWETLGKEQLRLGISDEEAGSKFAKMAGEALRRFMGSASDTWVAAKPQDIGKTITPNDPRIVKARAAVTSKLEEMVEYAADNSILVDGEVVPGYSQSRASKEFYSIYLKTKFLDEDLDTSDAGKSSEVVEFGNDLCALLGMTPYENKVCRRDAATEVIASKFDLQRIAEEGLDADSKAGFDVILDALNLSEEDLEFILHDKVRRKIEFLLEKQRFLPEDVRQLIEMGKVGGIDFNDGLVSWVEQQIFFEIELIDLIDSGEVGIDDYSAIGELAEGLQIPEDRVTKLVLRAGANRVDFYSVDACSNFMQDSDEGGNNAINQLVKHLTFAGQFGEVPCKKRDYLVQAFAYYKKIDLAEPAKIEILEEFLNATKDGFKNDNDEIEEILAKIQGGGIQKRLTEEQQKTLRNSTFNRIQNMVEEIKQKAKGKGKA